MHPADLSNEVLCGQLLVVGFEGHDLPPSLRAALIAGQRGGVIVFRRNLTTIEQTVQLCRETAAAAMGTLPPWIGIDEEGGRVRRLPSPALSLSLPSMRALAALGDDELIARCASAVAQELAVLGFNVNFAPVLDVDTNPDNPVIGDRAFGAEPEVVARRALAYLRGASGWITCCGKHFPGHGDTHLDSHLALPHLAHPVSRLDAVELLPFRAAIDARIPALMSAHIVVEALDPQAPATLSRPIATDLLRQRLGFDGVLFSDDLEMQAIAGHRTFEEAAVQAVAAGCDVLLLCHSEEAQQRAHVALVQEAERSPAFRARCVEAATQGLAARRNRPPSPASLETVRSVVGGRDSQAVALAIHEALLTQDAPPPSTTFDPTSGRGG